MELKIINNLRILWVAGRKLKRTVEILIHIYLLGELRIELKLHTCYNVKMPVVDLLNRLRNKRHNL